MIKSYTSTFPRLIRWILNLGLVLLLLMTMMRVALFLFFPNQGNSFPEVGKAMLLGLRYDLRSTAIILVTVLVFGSIPMLSPFRSDLNRKIWLNLLGVLAFLLLFFYTIDFAHFSYLNQRLNASVLNYLEDTSISLGMVWESYPVIRLILVILLVTFAFAWLLRLLFRKIARADSRPTKRTRITSFIAVFLVCGICIFGRFNQYPLRWSDAFALGSDYKANLALNPFESFLNSLKFRKSTYDLDRLRELSPVLREFLGIRPGAGVELNFARTAEPRSDAIKTRPNIVLVLCESFSGYKSSMWGNPLNTTPFFDSLSRKGLFFDHCFTPTYGTARGVWATVTGIPDVEMPTTASRNPLAVNQRTIINEFKNYGKFYFLGGSSSWANIRGLLTNNIDGLNMYEENSYRSPRIDVWGISDKNLFLEANEVLAKQDSPFFAIIQTADNHRPYTIPEEDRATFQTVDVPVDSLKKYGFETLAELNAFRYTDFCFEQFFNAARKEKYFENTIFAFIGDHGIPGNASAILPEAWTSQRLAAEHVPLLFYSPGLLPARRIGTICSQIDILPTLAGLLDAPYLNTSLGRDLLDTATSGMGAAFIFDPDYAQTGVVMGDHFFRTQLKTKQVEFVSIRNNDKAEKQDDNEVVMKKMKLLSDAIHEASKYLILNNKKEQLSIGDAGPGR
ncbi:MAG: LTA synthase family protein [Chitinophagaceae bacterium]|nr:MAG: LTA synthase family protein [Chitinophagaceae bacterium]